MRPGIKYRDGYKYQLAEDYTVRTDIIVGGWVNTEYIKLSPVGYLTVKNGYAWDGASAVAIDTPNIMRGSLCHDAFYQLMRQGVLSQEWRKPVDKEMHKMCLEDGMSRFRAWWIYQGLRGGGASSADPKNKKEILTAP